VLSGYSSIEISKPEQLLVNRKVGRLLRAEDVHDDTTLATHALLQLVELLEQRGAQLQYHTLGRCECHGAAEIPLVLVHDVAEQHASCAGVAHDAEDEGALLDLRGLLDVVRDVSKCGVLRVS
jgi:hypothetical protein